MWPVRCRRGPLTRKKYFLDGVRGKRRVANTLMFFRFPGFMTKISHAWIIHRWLKFLRPSSFNPYHWYEYPKGIYYFMNWSERNWKCSSYLLFNLNYKQSGQGNSLVTLILCIIFNNHTNIKFTCSKTKETLLNQTETNLIRKIENINKHNIFDTKE